MEKLLLKEILNHSKKYIKMKFFKIIFLVSVFLSFSAVSQDTQLNSYSFGEVLILIMKMEVR
jgi:hypothetical protein